MIKLLDFFILLLYAALIYWLSDQPSLPAPMWFPHQDKLYHAVVYFVLGLCFWRFTRHFIASPIILALVSFGLGSLYGASDEWHQSFVAGRSADWLDWLADTAGVGLAIVCVYQFRNLLLNLTGFRSKMNG